jgi:PRC-barrel domain protein
VGSRPAATKNHDWVGMPVVSSDGTDVGSVQSVILRRGDTRTTPPRSINVKEFRWYVLPLTRNLPPTAYKLSVKSKRIELAQTAAKHREQPTESWRPYWWQKNYWPANWTW